MQFNQLHHWLLELYDCWVCVKVKSNLQRAIGCVSDWFPLYFFCLLDCFAGTKIVSLSLCLDFNAVKWRVTLKRHSRHGESDIFGLVLAGKATNWYKILHCLEPVSYYKITPFLKRLPRRPFTGKNSPPSRRIFTVKMSPGRLLTQIKNSLQPWKIRLLHYKFFSPLKCLPSWKRYLWHLR